MTDQVGTSPDPGLEPEVPEPPGVCSACGSRGTDPTSDEARICGAGTQESVPLWDPRLGMEEPPDDGRNADGLRQTPLLSWCF